MSVLAKGPKCLERIARTAGDETLPESAPEGSAAEVPVKLMVPPKRLVAEGNREKLFDMLIELSLFTVTERPLL